MARRTHTETEPVGADSFLDVITNIVGILIILVMVVGERAKTAVVEVKPAGPSAELVAAKNATDRLEEDNHRLVASINGIRSETAAKAIERGALATMVAAIEQDMEAYRKSLDENQREQYAVDRDLALARDELSRLETVREMAEKEAAPQVVKIDNYPTPLGKTVSGDEAHVRLCDGRLSVLPYERLMNQLRGSLRATALQMQNQTEHVDTLGPVEGYRLRYVIQRQETAQGSLFQLSYVEFLPVSGRMGEPVDEALREGSTFRQALSHLSPHRFTITVWAYPDSFAEFVKLKTELHSLGYTVAARPLPEGMPIGASPNGSRSSAQ